jgi:putative ABC transport system permease protein
MTDWTDEIKERLGGLALDPTREGEIVEELSQHLEDRYRELIVDGANEADARAATAAELHQSLARERRQIEHRLGQEQTVLGSGGGKLFGGVLQDLRYGVRVLANSRGFTAIALLMLALGIGANTAIFQLIDAVRLRSLPVASPEELADIHIVDMEGARGDFSGQESLTNPIWEQMRDNQEAFSGIAAWHSTAFNLTTSGEVRYAAGLWVSGDFFNMLGVRPILGRAFAMSDDRVGCGASEAVISYSFWQREFGGDPAVVGRKLNLDFQPVEVIGVTPVSFHGPEVGRSFDVAVPVCSEPAFRGPRSHLGSGTDWWLAVFGRLKPGWTLERASTNMASISPAIFRATLPANYPAVNVKDYLGFRLGAFPAGSGVSNLRNVYSTSLNLLLAISGLVLLIACANLANLMLARASDRSREITIRLALGASRRRIGQQLLIESLLLALAGGGLGVLIAARLSRVLATMLVTQDSFMFVELNLDWRVLVFAASLAVATCVIFGLAPAISSTRSSPSDALKASGRGAISGRKRARMRRALVVVQVALSLILVVQALLFSRSLQKLMTLDPGFQQDGVLITGIDFSKLDVSAVRRIALTQDLISRIGSVPAVEDAAGANLTPISGEGSSNAVWMDGKDRASGQEVWLAAVSDGYFSTMRTPMLAGRDFNGSDNSSSPKTAVVNEAFAREFSTGANPVGQRFWIEATPTNPVVLYEIVGLVRNSKYLHLDEDFHSIAFLPLPQQTHQSNGTGIVIRSAAPLESVIASVKDTVSQVAPSATLDFTVLRTQIMDSLLGERLLAVLSGFFGILALLLACLGLYGIVSYGVANRTSEIGIRLALGSTRAGIVSMIVRETAALLLVGLAIGLGLAFASGLVVRSMLFGLSVSDPLILGVALEALITTGLAAAFIPARRAAGVDPMTALRYE